MHNFGTVLRFEVVRTLKKPTFWMSVLSVPLLGTLLLSVVYFSNKASEQTTDKAQSEKFSFVVHDASGSLPPQVVKKAGGTLTNDPAMARKDVQAGKVDAFFDYPKNPAKERITVYNKNDGLTENSKYTKTAELLLVGVISSKVSPETLSIIKNGAKTDQKVYEHGEEINVIGSMIIPAAFLVIFYMVIVLLANQMLTSTTEEKENRVTEMLLTSITSRALISGKIAALLILGCMQILVIAIPALLVYLYGREALNIPDVSQYINTIEFAFWPTFIGACLLVGSLLLFTGLTVAIGAAVPTAKEANSFFGFIILFMIGPFWITSFIMTNPGALVVQIFSFFPLTAPVTLMLRNVFGNLSPLEGLIGVGVVVLSSIVTMTMAIRIFRFGTLEYSKRISLKAIMRQK